MAWVAVMPVLLGVAFLPEVTRLQVLTVINSGLAIRLSRLADLLLNCGQCDDRKDEE